MDKARFIYDYTNICLKEIVHNTICIENWESKDFDTRYIECTTLLQNAEKTFSNKDDIATCLRQLKNAVHRRDFKALKDNILIKLDKKNNLSKEEYGNLAVSLENAANSSSDLGVFLKKVRELEEKLNGKI